MKPEKIKRGKAIELIKDAEYGYITVMDLHPKPAIGKVDPSSMEYEAVVETFQFGEEP